jgi:hypothetical protein
MMPGMGGAPSGKLDGEISDASGLIKPQEFPGLDSNGMPIEGLTETGGAMPGMPMMPGMGGAPSGKLDGEISDASGLLKPQEFPGLDSNGMPIEGVTSGGATPGMPMMPGAPSGKLDDVSDASGLIKPQEFAALDSNGMPIEGVTTGGTTPGMPMMPGMGGAPSGKLDGEISDASGLIKPQEFAALDSNGMPIEGVTTGGAMPGTGATPREEVSDSSGLLRPQEFAALDSNGMPVEGVTAGGAMPGMPMMPGATPSAARDEVSDASGLIKPQEFTAYDSNGMPVDGIAPSAATPAMPGVPMVPGVAPTASDRKAAESAGTAGAQAAHRVPVVSSDGGADETAAWEVAAGAAFAPLLFPVGRGRRDEPEVRINAISTERESTWTGEPERATWQPSRSAAGQGASVEEVPVFCGAGPEPVAAEPEPEEEPVEESEKDTDKTAVRHLLAQEATLWGGTAQAGPGVLE